MNRRHNPLRVNYACRGGAGQAPRASEDRSGPVPL